MKQGQLDDAKRRALNMFEAWNRTTGFVEENTGYYYELQAVIEDAVECGAQAASGINEALEAEKNVPIKKKQEVKDRFVDKTDKVKVEMKRPVPPVSRIIREGTIGTCPKCGSSEKRKWLFGKKIGCIQPECDNYYKKKANKINDLPEEEEA